MAIYTKEELTRDVGKLKEKLASFDAVLKIDAAVSRISEIQQQMSVPSFWNDQQGSKKLIDELKDLKDKTETYAALRKEIGELSEYASIADNEAMLGEMQKELLKLSSRVDAFELKVFLSEKFDRQNAIVDINAGAGGTEACDWAEMLFRMYARWTEEKKFSLEVVDTLRGDEAGIKSITLVVRGNYTYGYLKGERGVHRLVRISPFDANKRRHTSFASVDVIPEIAEDTAEFTLNPADLKIETCRSSGAGGQHVNKTESAVRIIHLPTGLVAQSQSERSQFQNKQVALSILRSRVYERVSAEKKKEIDSLAGDKKKIEWCSQIRSYVLYPYRLVKDHRTKAERTDANAVLDGSIDTFVHAYLRWRAEDRGQKTEDRQQTTDDRISEV